MNKTGAKRGTILCRSHPALSRVLPPAPVQRDPVVYPGRAWVGPRSETFPKTWVCAGLAQGRDRESGEELHPPCLHLGPPIRADGTLSLSRGREGTGTASVCNGLFFLRLQRIAEHSVLRPPPVRFGIPPSPPHFDSRPPHGGGEVGAAGGVCNSGR